jgi:hypothetical protein
MPSKRESAKAEFHHAELKGRECERDILRPSKGLTQVIRCSAAGFDQKMSISDEC